MQAGSRRDSRNVTPIALTDVEAVTQVRPHILLVVLDVVVLPARVLDQAQKVQAAAGVDGGRGVDFAAFEPGGAGARPGCAFEERVLLRG